MHLSLETVKCLRQLLLAPNYTSYGLEISKKLDIVPGTLYPILARLERKKLVQSIWEDADPKIVERPIRKLYMLTDSGKKLIQTILRDLQLP